MRTPPIHPRVATRATAVQLMRARLLREGFPRVQMFILVSLTGLAGFGASVAMLAAGVDTMALRYALAMGVAYLAFLLLLWLWLRTSAADYLDFLPSDGPGGQASANDAAAGFSGGGGSFDGGGASGNVDFGTQDSVSDAIADAPLDVGAEADETVMPLVVILLAVGIALSSLFVIWSAPILFAEILVDALLAAGLYRRLRVLEPQHWMLAALKRTILPFVLTTLTVVAAGWGMQAYAPEARSLGEVLASR
ncbi:hypothetical protein MasN3_35490 [Massilia varians]|uniref:Uncharacterized protein n=1 Tax=Massilia varians TaxID=457921 RepID=A0ABN6TCV0_9BURK|nr:hypothetical protein [Massilia varians]BDT60055.1 hypothetical protein MasN3_35490 [Massilia varians]